MRKHILFISIFIIYSCIEIQPHYYVTSLAVKNKTGYDIEIFKDDEYYTTFNNNDSCELFREKCPFDIEYINLEQIIKQSKKICFWKIDGDYSTFLKEWTYDNRNEPGKQLFRTSDYTQKTTIVEVNITNYQFSLTIYPEDIL